MRHGSSLRSNPAHLAQLSLIHTPASQDVLKYYGASKYGSGPPALGDRSPRESFNPRGEGFMRERGSYQAPQEHP